MPKPQVRPGRTLPPLRLARTRIVLLAGSYLDALSATVDGAIGGKPESRLPARNEELWPHGSYPELERAIDDLPEWSRPGWTNSFWGVYVLRGSRLVLGRNGRAIGYEGDPVHVKRPVLDVHGRQVVDRSNRKKWREETTRPFREFPLSEVMRADEIVAMLEKRLTDATIHVPAVVSESAGYLPSEAKAWDRWPKRSAA